MAKKLEVVNPVLPFTEIEIGGTTYKMCFNYGSLATAEGKLRAAGRNVSLLVSGPQITTFEHCRIVFACALAEFQPELTFDEAVGLCNFANCIDIYTAMQAAWTKSTPDPVPNPPKPGQ
jgi:hypothetical protein